MFLIDHGMPEKAVLDQLEMLGADVLPVLRKEWESLRPAGTPAAPTHEMLVEKKYAGQPPRQPRPNPNRGDNVTGTSPYQDSDPEISVTLPRL